MARVAAPALVSPDVLMTVEETTAYLKITTKVCLQHDCRWTSACSPRGAQPDQAAQFRRGRGAEAGHLA